MQKWRREQGAATIVKSITTTSLKASARLHPHATKHVLLLGNSGQIPRDASGCPSTVHPTTLQHPMAPPQRVKAMLVPQAGHSKRGWSHNVWHTHTHTLQGGEWTLEVVVCAYLTHPNNPSRYPDQLFLSLSPSLTWVAYVLLWLCKRVDVDVKEKRLCP